MGFASLTPEELELWNRSSMSLEFHGINSAKKSGLIVGMNEQDESKSERMSEQDKRSTESKAAEMAMKATGITMGGEAKRQSARSLLESMTADYMEQVRGIDVLLRALPMELSPEADEALWRLLIKVRRG